MRSSGVQITLGVYPDSDTTSLTRHQIFGFARRLQFSKSEDNQFRGQSNCDVNGVIGRLCGNNLPSKKLFFNFRHRVGQLKSGNVAQKG
ncbi:MAG: hypothetical protein ACI957_000309 [Verrucomicrobiales bacterium]|jgi:hypothetical protein